MAAKMCVQGGGFPSDSTSEVSILPCPFCLNSCNNYYDDIVYIKTSEETKADENINLNNAEQADVDGNKDLNMGMEDKEQIFPFCQKSFRTKDKVEQHIIIH